MSEREKQIMKNFEHVLPKLSEEKQNFILGYGEGMAFAVDRIEKNKDLNKNQEG